MTGQTSAPNIVALAGVARNPVVSTERLRSGADLTNVVPFARRRHEPVADTAPPVVVTHSVRPAPEMPKSEWRGWLPSLVFISVLLHSGACGLLDQVPPPLASIGVEVVSVELVLGDDRPTGEAGEPGQTAMPAPTPEDTPPQTTVAPDPQPPPQPTASSDTSQPPAPSAPPASDIVLPLPAPLPAAREPEAAAAQPPAKPPESATKPRAEPHRDLKRRQPPERQREAALPQGSAQHPANGVGRGRSDADTNYRGLVAAHLARFKQFPADAKSRGQQGVATVSFRLDLAGQVTSAALVHGSGVPSLDREVEAMVHRASPFPAPPSRQSMSFTVPVSFKLH